MGPIADRDRLARCMASGDILVHGSGAETYGLVVAEAICSGLAVVSPDTGGAADLARRGLSRIYATGEAESCGRAILALLKAVEAPGRRPPVNPPGSAESHFAALFKLYERLIGARDSALGAERAPLAKRAASA